MDQANDGYNSQDDDRDDEEVEAVPRVGLSFTDDKHTGQVLHSLNMMRKNRTFCDVVLHVGNSELYAHRAVLGSASPHLLEMFTADDDKGIKETIITYKLNGAFEKAALEKLIDYAYTAKLDLPATEVKSVFVAASQLKMDRVAKECGGWLAGRLTPDSCIEVRSLAAAASDRSFLTKVDQFIASRFEEVRQSPGLLGLPCVKIEVLSRSLSGMAMVGTESLCRLALDWAKRAYPDQSPHDHLVLKTHLLYLAMDNSLQDCTELPSGDASDTQIVQDYKRMSKSQAQPNKKTRKGQQPAPKPRVILYNRDIPESLEQDTDWKLIASAKVGDHSYLGLVTVEGKLATLSVMLRLNSQEGAPGIGTPPPQPAALASSASSASVDSAYGDPLEDDLPLYCGLASMGAFKCGAGCANLNNNLLVCGGYDRAECLRSVELYSPEQNTWASLAPMLEARGRFNIAVISGVVYAVGGCNGTTELATVEKYSERFISGGETGETRKGKWERIASLPMARSNTGVCSLGGKIYCIGGWNGQVGIKQCDVFDPETGKWNSVPPLQTGRYQAGVCSMEGRVWVVGGCDGWNCLPSVEVFDPQASAWTFAAHMITPRRGSGLAAFKGKLYVVGGSDGTQSLATTEVFDPEEKAWSPGPSMTTPRSNVGVAVIGSRLYAVGGFSGKTFLNSIEYLDDATGEWTTFSPKTAGPPDDQEPVVPES